MSRRSSVDEVTVAGGDPAELLTMARWHDDFADELHAHAALLDHTAASLTAAWQGQAASSYQGLSGTVAGHYRTAGDTSRSVAATLRHYAGELERYQREGHRCRMEAEHWQHQVATRKRRLAEAERRARAAGAAVAGAERQVSATAGRGPHHAAAHSSALATLARARGNLTRARESVHGAQRTLRHAEQELHHWRTRGGHVKELAEEAGHRASKTLASVTLVPPPATVVPADTSGATVALAAVGVGTAAAGSGSLAPTGDTASVAPQPAAVPAGAGTTAAGPSLPAVSGGAQQGAVTFGDLQEVGGRFGWSGNQLQAWWQVISDESGGNPAALNPGSGAFGIGQFLGSTYHEYLPYGAGSPNPMDQLNAMAQYIHNRYGSPLAALAHENAFHWY